MSRINYQDMYFITKKDSETGQKFQGIVEKHKIVHQARFEFCNKYGFDAYRQDAWAVYGGISSCGEFKETPDPKIWGKGSGKGEFFPKANSKDGKIIRQEIENLPVVSRHELNMCVGYEAGAPFNVIGFAQSNPEYFGFTTGNEWGIKIPADCEEVMYSKYQELFKK